MAASNFQLQVTRTKEIHFFTYPDRGKEAHLLTHHPEHINTSVKWLYIDSVTNSIHAGRINIDNERLRRVVLRFEMPVSFLPFPWVGHVSVDSS